MKFALNYNLGTRSQRFPIICFRASQIYMGDVSYYFCFWICNESCGTFRIYEWEEDELDYENVLREVVKQLSGLEGDVGDTTVIGTIEESNSVTVSHSAMHYTHCTPHLYRSFWPTQLHPIHHLIDRLEQALETELQKKPHLLSEDEVVAMWSAIAAPEIDEIWQHLTNLSKACKNG